MLTLRKTHCAKNLDDNLEELRRQADLESLRYHVMNEGCFHPHKDARSAQ